jgi:hypothetical protein
MKIASVFTILCTINDNSILHILTLIHNSFIIKSNIFITWKELHFWHDQRALSLMIIEGAF